MPNDLIRFVAEPMDFLKESINELNDSQKAALTVVFLNRSKLTLKIDVPEIVKFVSDKYGVSTVDISDAFHQLNGSFLSSKHDNTGEIWTFKHPTIADALSSILRERPDLVELYIRGAKIETLFSEVVCFGANFIEDAIVVPESINDLLTLRLLDTPDDPTLNNLLYGFMYKRASENVLRKLILQDPEIIRRSIRNTWFVWVDNKINLFAKLKILGLLPEDLREEVASKLQNKILYEFDASFLKDDFILALISPSELMKMAIKLNQTSLDDVNEEIGKITDNADFDKVPRDNFESLDLYLESIESFFGDSVFLENSLFEIRKEIEVATELIAEKKEKSDDVDWDWDAAHVTPVILQPNNTISQRSLFSDVAD